MRILLTFLLPISLLSVPNTLAQTQQQLENYLQRNPAADTNGDGTLSREEARAHRQRDPSRGDNLNSRPRIPAVNIPREQAPLKVVSLHSADGVDLSFAYRTPSGDGPFPTIVFFHGGGGYSPLQSLKNNLINGPIQTRFLQKGYLVVQSTRRPYWKSRNTDRPNGFYDAVDDTALVIETTKTLPGVDPDRVTVYGGSGGGILAIVSASKSKVASVVAGEPATVIPIDPKQDEVAGPGDYRSLMANPQSKFTAQRQSEMRAWMKEIECPVLILQGKSEGLYKTNFEILIPEMKSLGKEISSITYPGMSHGFYWGTAKTGATLETVEKVVSDVDKFIQSANEK